MCIATEVIGKNQEGKWQTVDRALVQWAWGKRDDREAFYNAYVWFYNIGLVNFVPCEEC